MSLATFIVGGLAFLALTFLPGAWLSFGLRLPGMPFWTRLWLGAALAPLVVIVPFYGLIWIGLPFQWTTIAVSVLSLTGIAPIAARRSEFATLPPRQAGLLLLLALPVVVLLILNAVPLQFSGFTGHAWLHTDVVYLLAGGQLRPEEPGLAGIRLSYPWLAYVHQAMQAWVLGSAPTASYMWVNSARLLVTVGLAWALADRLTGEFYAKLWTTILLLFGVNFVGYLLPAVLPASFVEDFPIWGDWRYTPWIRKFYFFNSMNAAMAMFTGMLLLGVESVTGSRSAGRDLLAALLIAAIGLVYPLLFPAALAVVGGVGVVYLLRVRREGWKVLRRLAGPALIGVAGAVATTLTLAWTTVDRGAGLTLGASEPYAVKLKAAESVIVLAPLLSGVVLALWHRRRADLSGPAVLILAALGSLALHAAFNILHYRNEYKYVTTAAIALAPLAGLGIGRAVTTVRGAGPVLTVIGALVLIAPGYHRRYRWDGRPRPEPRLDARSFDLRLAADERLAGALDVVRRDTPTNAVLVASDLGVHLPTLTRRALYVPFADVTYPGINVSADGLLADVRGYPQELIDRRRAVLHRLLEGSSAKERARALTEIRRLGRPVVIMVDEHEHDAAARWLGGLSEAARLFHGGDVSVWLLPAALDRD